MTVTLGILDSGVGAGMAAASARFAIGADGEVARLPAIEDRLGHGTVIAGLIRRRIPAARLLSAQVFNERGLASPVTVAAGMAWLVGQGARVINMSFGLVDDRQPLRQACHDAVAAGVLIVASVPAMGPLVYPAAYPGVIRVTGDGRCTGAQLAAICSERADFGANPWPGDGFGGAPPQVAGASIAAARITAALAIALAAHPTADAASVVEHLLGSAVHRGPQRTPLHA